MKIRDVTVRLRPEHVQVMRLVARGQTYHAIGLELGMSRSTVKALVRDVRNRLGTDSTIEACLLLSSEVCP